MIEFFKKNIEPKSWLRKVEIIFLILLCIGSIASFGFGLVKMNADVGQTQFVNTIQMTRDMDLEDL